MHARMQLGRADHRAQSRESARFIAARSNPAGVARMNRRRVSAAVVGVCMLVALAPTRADASTDDLVDQIVLAKIEAEVEPIRAELRSDPGRHLVTIIVINAYLDPDAMKIPSADDAEFQPVYSRLVAARNAAEQMRRHLMGEQLDCVWRDRLDELMPGLGDSSHAETVQLTNQAQALCDALNSIISLAKSGGGGFSETPFAKNSKQARRVVVDLCVSAGMSRQLSEATYVQGILMTYGKVWLDFLDMASATGG